MADRNDPAGLLVDQVLDDVFRVAGLEDTTGDAVTLRFRVVVAALAGARFSLGRVSTAT